MALVGESGSGKTTIADLIERLYDICGGEILIDGLDIRKYDINYLRRIIGYVQQEPFLFNETIRYNLVLGREEELKSLGNMDQLIQEACYDAGISELINNLPGGLDYVVKNKKNKFYRGQKQKIALARAILCKPKILILDGITAALDYISQKEIQKALDNISQMKMTTIIISNKLSLIKNADIIYAIKDGQIIEQGTHNELLGNNGFYANLIGPQLAFNEFESENQNEELYKSLISKSAEKDIYIENREDKIAVKWENVHVNICNIFRELKNYKLDLIIGCIATLIKGAFSGYSSLVMSNGMNAINSKYETIRYDDTLKYAFIFLAMVIIQSIASCIMNWKFMALGDALARIYRQKLLKQYLSLHLAFYNVIENSPILLLIKLVLDTKELNNVVNSILGVMVQCIVIIIVALIIGCYYEYRLTLISICFAPFIYFAHMLRRGLLQGCFYGGVKSKLEAGILLSETVKNTKTIFCYNAQDSISEKYAHTIEYMPKFFYRYTLFTAFFVAIGLFASFASKAAIFSRAKKYILDGSIDSEDMMIVLIAVSSCAQDISSSMGNLGDIKQ